MNKDLGIMPKMNITATVQNAYKGAPLYSELPICFEITIMVRKIIILSIHKNKLSLKNRSVNAI